MVIALGVVLIVVAVFVAAIVILDFQYDFIPFDMEDDDDWD